MTPTPRNPKSYNKTLDLSPEARAALKLPLMIKPAGRIGDIHDADGQLICQVVLVNHSLGHTNQLAYFIKAVLNEALTPAAPAVTVIPETNTELNQLVTNEIEAAEWPGVPMCADPECLNAADLTSRGGYCQQHTAARWTAAEIMRREG